MREADKTKLLAGWQRWRTTLAEAMDGVHDAIEEGRFLEASQIMDQVTQQQAQMSLAMRNILIRAGVIRGEEVDSDD